MDAASLCCTLKWKVKLVIPTVHSIIPGVWRLHEESPYSPVDAYLVCGREQAVLIDALESAQGVLDQCRKLTELPLSLAVTHGHFDHAGKGLDEFLSAGLPVYMDPVDIPTLEETRGCTFAEGTFRPYPSCGVMKLGGVELEILSVPGHTVGSKVFLDRARGMLFTGDAVGSGVFWMQLPHCAPLHVLKESLDELCLKIDGIDGLKVFGGHVNQAPCQLTRAYIDQVRTAVQRVLSGEAAGEDMTMEFQGRHIRYRVASEGLLKAMCYDPYRL